MIRDSTLETCYSALMVKPRKRPAVRRSGRQSLPGRKPAGLHGEPVRSYPPMTWRVPPDTRVAFQALAVMRQLPAWRLFVVLTDEAVAALSAGQRRLHAGLVQTAMRARVPKRG